MFILDIEKQSYCYTTHNLYNLHSLYEKTLYFKKYTTYPIYMYN